MKALKLFLFSVLFSSLCLSQPLKYDAPGAGNPIIAGYFADPTIKKFGDTYYLYATTDGNGGGKGPSQVWVSKDFQNWTLMPMNWPTTLYYWAPDVMEYDGKYYLYYCQPCMLYCGVSETPRGPWKNILGEDEAVLVPDGFVKGAITLDGQTFVDDDGSAYLYWGTWGIYPDHGCGAGKLTIDKKAFSLTDLIPNTEATDFFEAPFMIKKDSVYYFTYSSGSCHDHTYRVQYAVSKEGPLGPFTFPKNNPILETNDDRTVHGPGHHSILHEGDRYYMVYHRHNLPNSTRGMHRQIAVDTLRFGGEGIIEKVVPTHNGIGLLQPSSNPFANLAYGKKVTASSCYNDDFRPEYAVDDNNATLWRPKSCGREWLQVDLGEVKNFCRVWTQFEYPTAFVQYLLESSTDGKEWRVYSDRRDNLLSGSPMVDYGKVCARYLRLTFTGAQNNGTSAALWNIKVFEDYRIDPPQCLIDMPAAFFTEADARNRMGMLAGAVKTLSGDYRTVEAEGVQGIAFATGTRLQSTWEMPRYLYCRGGAFTLTYRLYGDGEALLDWRIGWGNSATQFKSGEVKNISAGWHTVAFICDGEVTRKYIDSQCVGSQKVAKKRKQTEAPLEITGNGKGILSHLRLYNWAQSLVEVEYDVSLAERRLPQAAPARQGLLAHLQAADHLPGTSVKNIINKSGITGEFRADRSGLNVVLKNRRTAFFFDGTQTLQSSFSLPATMQGNAPYSVAAWILNPELEEQEIIADLNRAGGELEKIAIGYGRDARAGIALHNGEYENMGIRGLRGDNEWHHLAVSYDGYKEYIYLDGELKQEKDIVLRLPEGQPVTVGNDFTGRRPFTGYLSELYLYDTPLTAEEVQTLYHAMPKCDAAIELNPAEMDYAAACWNNEGDMGGKASFPTSLSLIDIHGKIALGTPFEITNLNSPARPVECVLLTFAAARAEAAVLHWDNGEIDYHAKKKILTVKVDGRSREIKEIENATSWIYMVWLPKAGKCYVNGIGYEIEPMEMRPEKGIAVGEKTARFGLYYRPFDAAQVEQMYREGNCRSVDKVKGRAVVATPAAVNLSVWKEETEENSFMYMYSNLKTGWNTGWSKQDFARESGLTAGERYPYQIRVRDAQGNVSEAYKGELLLDESLFSPYVDAFDVSRNYTAADGCVATIWDGVDGYKIKDMQITAEKGELKLGSADREFTATGNKNGPFIYKEVNGDFVAQVELVDFSGYKERRAIGMTEGGLMIMTEREGGREGQQLMHLGCFPYWNVGNMLTEVGRHGRPQYFNKKGYDLDRFMQIERNGDYFFFRSSADGVTWEDLPSTPLYHPELKGKSLKVGLYQMSYRAEYGTVTFDNFKMWIKK